MRSLPSPARDVLALVARLGLGFIFVMHGWQKLVTNGVAATQEGFAGMGAPVPDVAALVAIVLELGGGIALMLGAFTPVVGILLALHMVAAALIAHQGNGFFVANGGPSYVLALAAGALALAAMGAGRFSLDGALARRRGAAPAATPA